MHSQLKISNTANCGCVTENFQSQGSGRLVYSSFQGLKSGRCFCNTSLSHSKSGQARITDKLFEGFTQVASRLSYQLLAGPLEVPNYSGKADVLHRCGYPACINPSHLYIGSHAQNTRDREFHARVRSSMPPDALPTPISSFKEVLRSGVQIMWPMPLEFSQEVPLAESKFQGIGPIRCIESDWNLVAPEILRRMMWKLFVGPINKSRFPLSNILNSCHHPKCINPHHLRLNIPSGSWIGQTYGLHRNRKLSEENIAEIRASTKGYAELGREFGVHSQTIGNVKRYQA